MSQSQHETFDRAHAVPVASERSFGIVFAVVFALVAAYRAWHGHDDWRWLAGVSADFAALAFLWTAPLVPLNRAWAWVGKALHAIVNPLVMGLIFALAVVPTGLVLRLLGKDLLRLRRDPAADSYWVRCDGRAGSPGQMNDQF